MLEAERKLDTIVVDLTGIDVSLLVAGRWCCVILEELVVGCRVVVSHVEVEHVFEELDIETCLVRFCELRLEVLCWCVCVRGNVSADGERSVDSGDESLRRVTCGRV